MNVLVTRKAQSTFQLTFGRRIRRILFHIFGQDVVYMHYWVFNSTESKIVLESLNQKCC